MDNRSRPNVAKTDLLVVHAWRRRGDRPELNVPLWVRRSVNIPIILFNHDWQGSYEAHADLVLVYSAFAAANWSGDQRLAILPGGITVDRFARVAEGRLWRTCSVIGRLSTLHSGKASPDVLLYWSRVNGKKFLVGGDGSELHILKTKCRDVRFEFRGEIPPRQTHEFLREIDVFLYDTPWHVESFGYVILEALAAGCVVVARDSGAVGELIENNINGFLFKDPREAVDLCNHLLADSGTCRTVSKAAAGTGHRFPSSEMRRRFAAHVEDALGNVL
jgi:glycosyltransferase involved in cell wall biosynthesis